MTLGLDDKWLDLCCLLPKSQCGILFWGCIQGSQPMPVPNPVLTSPEASYGFSDPPNVGQARFKRQHMPLGRPSSVLPGAWTNPIQTRQLQRSICKVPRLQISTVPGPFAWLESVDGRMAKKIKNLPNVCPVRINFKHFSWEGAVGSKLTASKCHAA